MGEKQAPRIIRPSITTMRDLLSENNPHLLEKTRVVEEGRNYIAGIDSVFSGFFVFSGFSVFSGFLSSVFSGFSVFSACICFFSVSASWVAGGAPGYGMPRCGHRSLA